METGQRKKDSAGKIVPAWFIQEVNATHNSKTVMTAQWGPSVAKNPFLQFVIFISFGGPAGQIAIMHEELVERAAGSGAPLPACALNYCMVLPGPGAAARHLHRLADAPRLGRHRRRRAVRAALAVHPDRAVVGLSGLRQPARVAGLFYGIKPAVTALVVHAAWRIGPRAEERPAVGHRRVPSSPSSRSICPSADRARAG